MARKDYSSRDHAGTKITGVAAGVADTDAANMAQLNAVAGGTGITQNAADIRYVNVTGDTMTGDLKVDVARHHGVEFREPGGERRVVGIRTTTSGVAGLGAFKAEDDATQPLLLQPFGVGNPTQVEHAATKSYVDPAVKPPFAKYSAGSRTILTTVWTQFTAISITEQRNGTFSGGSNMTVPASGIYQVNYKILSNTAGRLIGSVTADGLTDYGSTEQWAFDDRAFAANSWISGPRALAVSNYITFWVYTIPQAACQMQAEVFRVGD